MEHIDLKDFHFQKFNRLIQQLPCYRDSISFIYPVTYSDIINVWRYFVLTSPIFHQHYPLVVSHFESKYSKSDLSQTYCSIYQNYPIIKALTFSYFKQ